MATRQLVPCPSTAAYKRGCRCKGCTLEYCNYMRKRRGLPELMPDTPPTVATPPKPPERPTMPTDRSYMAELVDKQQRTIVRQRELIDDLFHLLEDAAQLVPEYRWKSIGWRIVDAQERARRMGSR